MTMHEPFDGSDADQLNQSSPNVLQIVADYLDREGFDGLYAAWGRCGCKKDDLAPCGEIGGTCIAGYLQPCPSDCGDHDWHIGPETPQNAPETEALRAPTAHQQPDSTHNKTR